MFFGRYESTYNYTEVHSASTQSRLSTKIGLFLGVLICASVEIVNYVKLVSEVDVMKLLLC